jgi:RimJ/RimL family protein N-acetyltransferase
LKTLALGHDAAVVEWAKATFGYQIMNYDMAIGVVDEDRLVASVLVHNYNGSDLEASYYGPKTLDLGVLRKLVRIAVDQLGVSRITVRTARNNKTMTRGIKKLGFEFEGIRKHAYGEYDAVMYGLYGAKLMRLAGRKLQ